MSIQLSDQEKAFLKHLSKILTQQEKQIFKAKILGLKQKEIAFLLSISQQTVSRRLKRVSELVSKNRILALISEGEE